MSEPIVKHALSPELLLIPDSSNSPPLMLSQHDRNRVLVAGYENWMIARNFAASTRRQYARTARRFIQHIGSASIQDKGSIRSFLVEASNDASRVTQSKVRHHLRSFYKFLTLAGIVGTGLRVSIPVLTVPEHFPRVLTEEEVERLLALTETPLDKALLEFAYATGLRSAELLNLRIEDLNLEAGSFLVRQGKNNEDRIGFFGSRAQGALFSYLRGRSKGPVFLGIYGRGGLSRVGLFRIVRRAAERAGLSGVHPHTLRHCFATHLLNRGTDIHYVQQLLGHKNLSATQIYTHMTIVDLRREHSRFHPRKEGSDEKA
jgi:site-specific recombinase XerD